MDANRFDDLVKALSRNTARRGMVAGLLGALSSLLVTLESESRRRTSRRTHRDADLSAEKKRKKKCKSCGPCKKCKKGRCKPKPNGTPCAEGSCQSGACKPEDQIPPCTEASCPVPPGCSQTIFDECGTALVEALQADAEACRPDCEGGDSPACRACLEPIVTARQPEAEACIVRACSSSGGAAVRQRGKAQGGATAHAGGQRLCDKPCCANELYACVEDLDEEFLLCMGGALLGCFAGPACALGMLGCLAKAAYDNAKCETRYGCQGRRFACTLDNTCCNEGEYACEHSCCREGTHCCPGGGCCHDGDTCCFRQSSQTLFCCPPGAQCMQTGIPCCSNC